MNRKLDKETKESLVRQIKKECNYPKQLLIKEYAVLRRISPKNAKKLDRIIANLEKWQNT